MSTQMYASVFITEFGSRKMRRIMQILEEVITLAFSLNR